MIVLEDILGRCAPLLGIDPIELRHRNFYRAGQSTPYGQPVRHPERLQAVWGQTIAAGDLRERRLRQVEEFNATHEHIKRGLAMTPVKFGISFNLTAFNQAGALVLVYKDGSVLINHGGTEMGQGLHTKMLQVAATTLGIPLARVRLAPTRTDKVPNTSATAASSGADLNGGAVKNACEQIRDRLLSVAGGMLGINAHDVRIVDGVARPLSASEETHVGWDELVAHGVFPARPALGLRVLPHRGTALGLDGHAGQPVQVLCLRGGRDRGRGRRLYRGVSHAARRHRARRRRQSLAADRHRPDRRRLRAGRRVAHARGPALGHQRRSEPRPLLDAVGKHLQAAELILYARDVQRHAAARRHRGGCRVRLQGGRGAAVDAGVLGP